MKLCFATNNAHKITEVQQLLGSSFEIVSLQDIGCAEELPETQNTLEGNSAQKARFVYEHYQVDCFADDTGLEIQALKGEPGVYSARYAGPQRDNQANMQKVLNNLEGETNRQAQFRTVITLILAGKEYAFEGTAPGTIAQEPSGHEGFGYDPIFIPEGYEQSFAEMLLEEKNQISHRGKAVQKLVGFLQNQS
uniref:dITP/XTP pyrophosphatase n=1 Tax=Roseihalotalea indica TaxID=2867963 RepID=A0AA49JFN6_9BACT|nr:non-canonical purine NTP diphosphatase [Tunicatimonas sp. TK19036]